ALTARSVGESVLEWLDEIGEGEIGRPETKTVKIGSSEVMHRVVQAPERKWPRRAAATSEDGPAIHTAALARLWDERTAGWQTVRASTWHVTPSSVRENLPLSDLHSAAGVRGRHARRRGGRV